MGFGGKKLRKVCMCSTFLGKVLAIFELLATLRKLERDRKSKTLRLHNWKLKEEIVHKPEINL